MFTRTNTAAIIVLASVSIIGCQKHETQTGGSALVDKAGNVFEEEVLIVTESDRNRSETLEADAALKPTVGNKVSGNIHFKQTKDGIEVQVELSGLQANSEHGFHIHETGDCSAPDGTSAGGHYAPNHNPHALPPADRRHGGDMGNVVANDTGSASLTETFHNFSLAGDHSVLGRAVIVHANADTGAQPTGAAGARIDCGVIKAATVAPKLAAGDVEQAKDMQSWPDGWLVITEDELAPVVDELGERLHAARKSFQAPNKLEAASNIRRGAVFLKGEITDEISPQGKKSLKAATRGLEKVAAKLESKQKVTLAELDAAFANAHKADIEQIWVFRSEEDVIPFMNSPQSHYREALRQFNAKQPKLAAHEVRKAAAFYRLQSARQKTSKDKNRFNKGVGRLDKLASRLEAKNVRSAAALESEFHQAEELRQGRKLKGWAIQTEPKKEDPKK